MRNGNITSYETNFFYGATLLFECNEGYELKGSETVSCLENGWIPRRWPYCSSKCIWWNPAEAFNRTGRKYHVIQNKKKFMEGGFWPSSLSPISFHHFPCFCFVLFCFVFFVFFFSRFSALDWLICHESFFWVIWTVHWMMWNMPFHSLFWISNWNPNRESLSWSWKTRRRSPIWIQNSWKYDAVFLSSRI